MEAPVSNKASPVLWAPSTGDEHVIPIGKAEWTIAARLLPSYEGR